MSARKIFSIICLSLTVLLFVCIFLPFLDLGSYGGTYSFWEYLDKSNASATAIILMIELIIAIIAYILQLTGVSNDAKLAYLGLGYYTSYHISLLCTAINNSATDQLAFGYWLGLIFSLVVVILTFIGSFVSNKSRPKYEYALKPVGYDPKTGKPIYAKPKGFDPATGKPIFDEE